MKKSPFLCKVNLLNLPIAIFGGASTAIGTSWTALSTCTPPALLTRSVHIISMAAAAQKGSVVGKPASDILLTDESTQEMATLRENIIDGKSTVVLEWWGFH